MPYDRNFGFLILKTNMELFKILESEFSEGKSDIEKIVEQAKKEETEWRKVIAEFNRRFFVPFEISVDNQEDVILKSEGPSIKFIFKEDFGDSTKIEEDELFKVLSGGELRALLYFKYYF